MADFDLTHLALAIAAVLALALAASAAHETPCVNPLLF